MSFTVAIIGRPNVGKSTLFNRLVGKRLALVDDTPGVTRDRRMGEAKIGDIQFEVIDTAGLEEAARDSLAGRMRSQTEAAVLEADISFFVIDARAGVVPADKAFASMLRKSGGKVILVANKVEGNKGDSGYYESFGMGFGDPIPISAEHGDGMVDLRDALVAQLGEEVAFGALDAESDLVDQNIDNDPEDQELDEEAEFVYDNTRPLRIAVVGRPNAGKSTLINQFLGEDRLLTGPEAGITRDSISVNWQWHGRTIKLFDTAGMRRRSRVHEKLEKLSVADGRRAIQYAEVVIIMFDATMPFEKQDMHIVDQIIKEGRAPVIAFNKWDLIDDRQKVLKDLHEKAERLLPQVKGLLCVPVSGETGYNIEKLLQAVFDVHVVWNRRIPTAKLNRWLEGSQIQHPPPAVGGRRIRLKYISQPKSRPPTFSVQCTRPESLPTSYSRYLMNGIREAFDLYGTPIRLFVRGSENPFAKKKKK
jgi:GTP-binding protein